MDEETVDNMRDNFDRVLDDVEAGDACVVSRDGESVAVIISIRDYNELRDAAVR